ncbi:MAG: hypothetical protein CM1200mP9_10910 [Gammaproteobacteria bacterium]|nr:MAG: hypothetical protein CM1200mP9_10910 [Gammaproteobacteria bacterium]
MLKACLAAEGKVGLMMNVRRADLEAVVGVLPALQTPTVSALADEEWVDVNSIVEESFVRSIVPKLKIAGRGALLSTRSIRLSNRSVHETSCYRGISPSTCNR